MIADNCRPEGGTTCQMHAQELVLKHALGLCNQRKGGSIVDLFPAGKDLRDVCKAFASKVMDKKSKHTLTEYEALSEETYHVTPCHLLIPNETRVSGTFTLFTSLLRARSLIQLFVAKFINDYKNCIIHSEQWKLVAEFQAVMTPMDILSKASQTNEPGEVAFSWFEVACCRAGLKSPGLKYKVVDCSQSWAPNIAFESIPKAELPYEQLSPVTRQFVDRLHNELSFYFPKADSDQLMAMKLHPVMNSVGMK